jgi:hypothetical protein
MIDFDHARPAGVFDIAGGTPEAVSVIALTPWKIGDDVPSPDGSVGPTDLATAPTRLNNINMTDEASVSKVLVRRGPSCLRGISRETYDLKTSSLADRAKSL